MSIISFFRKRFTEVFHYYSEQTPILFRQELEQILAKKSYGKNIAGRFISEDQFEVHRLWEIGTSSTFSNSMMYLYGEIIQTDKTIKGTHLIISVTSPGAPFAFVISSFAGLALWAFLTNNDQPLLGLLGGFILFIGAAIPPLQFGYYSKNRLRKNFAKACNLTLIPLPFHH